MKNKQGSCRESAWLLMQVYRHLGLVTRFVSGYQVILEDKVSEDGQQTITNNRTDLHAWVEVYVPGAGRIGLVQSASLLASKNYIPLACTPSPESAAPISGKTTFSNTDLKYFSTVIRI